MLVAQVSQAEKDFEEQQKAFAEANQPPKLTKNIPLRRQRLLLEQSQKAADSHTILQPAELKLPKYGGFIGFFAEAATIIDDSLVGTALELEAACR